MIALDAATDAVAKHIPVADRRGTTSRIARLLDAAPRKSFIVLLADIPEAWELPYDPGAEPVFDGMVHDYRTGEGIAARGPLPVRRIVLDVVITDGLFSPRFDFLVAAVPGGRLHVVNLHVRKRIETIDTGGDPRPEDGVVWRNQGSVYLIPDRAQPRLLAVDGTSWRRLPDIELPSIASAVRMKGDGVIVILLSGGEIRVDAEALLPR